MALVSLSTMERLREEARELFGKVKEGVTVGAAELVVYDTEWASHAGIGQFGRITLTPDTAVYHAGPKKIDRVPRYQLSDNSVFDYVDQWREGKGPDPPIKKLLGGEEWPQLIEPRVKDIASYESKIFQKLLFETPITLVNPSFATLASLIKHTTFTAKGYVTVTSQDQTWIHQLKDFARRSEGRIEFLPRYEVRGLAYLGSASPVWYPPTPWFRLIPSPFIEPTVDVSGYSVQVNDEGIDVQYLRKGHRIYSHLERDSRAYVFNPESVDAYLQLRQPWRLVFVESSVPIRMPTQDDSFVYHKPFFVSVRGEWKEFNQRKWLVEGNVVYDVLGRGTYLSRRQRDIPPDGYHWAPLEEVGTHFITYSSISPHKSDGVNVYKDEGRTVVSLDGTIPIVLRTRRVRGTPHFNRDDVTPISEWSIRPNYYTPTEIREDNQGNLYHPADKVSTGVLWRTMTNEVLSPTTQHDGFMTIPVYSTRKGSYIDIGPFQNGLSFIAKDKKSMVDSIPGIYRYISRNWAGMLTWSQWHLDADDGGFSSKDVLTHRITSILSSRVYLEGDKGQTVYSIAHIADVPVRVVREYLLRIPEAVMWSQQVGFYEEWAWGPGMIEREGRVSWYEVVQKARQKESVVVKSRQLRSILQFNGLSH